MDFLVNDYIYQEIEISKDLDSEEIEENLDIRNDETQM